VRLAELIADPDERARHLALGTDESSASISAELESASRRSLARGAPAFAGELAERAVELTPASDVAGVRRRTLLASEAHLRSGNLERGAALLEPIAEDPEAAAQLGAIRRLQARDREAAELLAVAVADPTLGPGLRARAGMQRVGVSRAASSPTEEADAALRLARASGEPGLVVAALQRLAFHKAWSGEDVSALEREARELVATETDLGVLAFAAIALWFEDDVERARPRLEERLRRAVEIEDPVLQAETSASLSELERRAGNLGAALRYAEQGLAIAQAELYVRAPLAYAVSMAKALVGDVDGALEAARRCAAWAHVGPVYAPLQADWCSGSLALVRGDLPSAAAAMRGLPELEHAVGLENPTAVQYHADAVEALVGIGAVSEASAIADDLARRGQEQGLAWATAAAARSRGLIAGGAGDLDAGSRSFDLAIAWYEEANRPVDLARTLLARGRTERRSKRRAAARETLARALELFDAVGAALWAEQAANELGRVSGRAPTGSALTATERRVADLVCQGLSNKEVAGALFVTVRTVEAHLTKIYSKLGVRSRTELAALHRSQP
jgi:DNA-binding CsgD family transcriptional regulator